MKRFILAMLMLFALCGISYSEEPQICFKNDDASRMVVELQKCRFTEEELSVQEKRNLELMNQKDKQEKLAKELERKFQSCSEALGKTEILMKEKDKACEEKVKAAKPSLWSMISGALGCLGLGLLIGVLL